VSGISGTCQFHFSVRMAHSEVRFRVQVARPGRASFRNPDRCLTGTRNVLGAQLCGGTFAAAAVGCRRARSGDFAPFSLEQLARLLLRARVAAFVARVELLTQKMIDNKV